MKKYKYRKRFTYNHNQYVVYADTLEQLGEKKAKKIAELEKAEKKESEITVQEWTERCIATYKTSQAESTLKVYKYRVNHCILDYIGDLRMKDITPILCQEVLNKQAGKSKSHISEVANAMKFIFSHAVYNDIIHKDPTFMLKKPKGNYTPRRALSTYERIVFLDIAETDRKYYAFLLMLYCGCRPLEACECKGSDIYEIKNQPMLHIRGTKTKNADRNVPIPKELFSIIKDTPKREYIALHNGKQITPDARRKIWHKLWRDMNIAAGTKLFRNQLLEPYIIPNDITPYSLRHTYCTDLAKRGVDIRIAQRLMGHSEIALTANIYTHVDDNDVINALNNTVTYVATPTDNR